MVLGQAALVGDAEVIRPVDPVVVALVGQRRAVARGMSGSPLYATRYDLVDVSTTYLSRLLNDSFISAI